MKKLYSAADAAKRLQVSSSTVRRACIKHGIGFQVPHWVVTDEDIKKLAKLVSDTPGNPNFKPKKKSAKRKKK